MATAEEEDDLEALRIAVLASMKPKVDEKPSTPVSEDEEDPELSALRAAALKSKGQNSSTVLSRPTPAVSGQYPKKASHKPYGRGRGRGRGQYGLGRGQFRGGKSGSNLIVINTVPEDCRDSAIGEGRPANKRETSAGNVFLRPQDKWAGSLSDSNSAASTPTRSKVPNKFSRFDSSGTDTDSDSDNELWSPEDDRNKSSDEEEDILNHNEDTININEDINAEKSSAITFKEDTNVKNDFNDDSAKLKYAIAEIPLPSVPKNENGNKKNNGSDDGQLNEQKNLSLSPVKENAEVIKADHGNTDAMSRILGRKIHQAELFNAENLNLTLTKETASSPARLVNVNSASNTVNSVSNPPSNKSVKDRLGIGPVSGNDFLQSPSNKDPVSPSKCQTTEMNIDVENMTPEEKKLFEARRKKFVEIMEVQDLKKTVSLKGIVPAKKSKKELPKQYRHRRNRSRSNSRSPSGKVSSSLRKRERRKHKESVVTAKPKPTGSVSKDSSTARKRTVSVNADSDTETKAVPETDSDSSDSNAEPWRFQHTGKAGKQDRRSGKNADSVFERKAEDLNRERRQRRNIERTIKNEKPRETSQSRKSNSVHKPPDRMSRNSNERRKARFVVETSTENLDKNSAERTDKNGDLEKQKKSTSKITEKTGSVKMTDKRITPVGKTEKNSIVLKTDKDSCVKPVVTSVVKLDNDSLKSSSSRKRDNRKNRDKTPESDSMSNSSYYSSSEEDCDKNKKRDARSIIVSLRQKEGKVSDFSVPDKPSEASGGKKRSESRTSPVMNITFNSERSKIKPSLSSEDRGSIHRRLGLPISSRLSSESHRSSKKNKRTRKVIEESCPETAESRPFKIGISKSDTSIPSQLQTVYTNSDSKGAKNRRQVKTDCRDPVLRDRTKSTSDLLIKTDKSPELKTVHRVKRKSTGGTEFDSNKKIKLSYSEDLKTRKLSSGSNHSKGDSKEEISLDERIRRINEKNQAILKRRQEIMEDKKKYG